MFYYLSIYLSIYLSRWERLYGLLSLDLLILNSLQSILRDWSWRNLWNSHYRNLSIHYMYIIYQSIYLSIYLSILYTYIFKSMSIEIVIRGIYLYTTCILYISLPIYLSIHLYFYLQIHLFYQYQSINLSIH